MTFSRSDLIVKRFNEIGQAFSEDPLPLSESQYEIWPTDDINVYFWPDLNGGGTRFSGEFIHVIKSLYPGRHFENAFEWCSGPGFIGFSLLSKDLCENLYLGDIHGPCEQAVEQTKKHLHKKYRARKIEFIDLSKQDALDDHRFDLIVANPPHWNYLQDPFISDLQTRRIYADDGWRIHQRFFDCIKKNLASNGVILLQESALGSHPKDFDDMISRAGLVINRVIYHRPVIDTYPLYYLEITHK